MSLGLCTSYDPPEKRRSYAEGGVERRLTEAAVMLALAHHLLSEPGPATVTICPDGEHAKRFDIPAWLATRGFEKIENLGSTSYGGLYVRGDKTVVVNPRSGIGDVTGKLGGRAVVCECKGGTINSKHSGRQSLLRKGLLETVGALLALPVDGARQIAAVPLTPLTQGLAEKLSPRCGAAGIEIALVREDGSIHWVEARNV
jgi:hypothetical protein